MEKKEKNKEMLPRFVIYLQQHVHIQKEKKKKRKGNSGKIDCPT
jgi:putative transposon-encoded protein